VKKIVLLIAILLAFIPVYCQQKVKLDPFFPKSIYTPQISIEIRPIETVRHHNHPVYLFTVFFPEFLYVKNIDEKELIKFWDRVVSQDACNGTRIFVGHSSWSSKYEPWIIKPFLKDENGRYILPELDESIEDFINPEWKSMLIRRLKILRDREIFRSIDLWDFCQMHYRDNSSWNSHWLKQIDDDPYQAFNIYSDSFKYVEKFTRYIVGLIWEEEIKYIRPDWNTSLGFCPGNETPPIKEWNDRILEIIDEEVERITPGVQMYRWQKMNSALPHLSLPLGIDDKCLYQLHQIDSLKTYNRLKNQIVMRRFMASLDGARNEEGNYFLIEKSEALRLINQIIIDRNFGLELRVGHGEEGLLPSEENNWMYNLNVVDLDTAIAVVKEYKKFIK